MKIAVLEPLGIPDADLRLLFTDALDELGDVASDVELVTYPDRREDEETLAARSAGADVVVLSNIPYPSAVMARNPALKHVCVAFTGYDHVDMAYCRERGIQVSNCAGYSTEAVGDIVFALVIVLCGQLVSLAAWPDAGGGVLRLFKRCFGLTALTVLMSFMTSIIYLKVIFWREDHDLDTSGATLSLVGICVAALAYTVGAVAIGLA